MNSNFDAIIIGGGLSGLTCARNLCEANRSCLLIEASGKVGGRVTTDQLDGFLLDRGFQVFLTAYPEAASVLDYDRLQLCPFEPGALIRWQGKFHRLSDPWRRPQHLLATATSPVGTVGDKLRIASFRKATTNDRLEVIYGREEQSTLQMLRQRGFSDVIIERFFRPFLGGVFLESELHTSSRMAEFVFRMFSLGEASLPKNGMEEIPRQIAASLPPDVVRLQCRAEAIEGNDVLLSTGERVSAKSIVVATEAPAARKLLGDPFPAEGQSVQCLYFSADRPPVNEAILVLNGEGTGPINNLCVPSCVSAAYAPEGKSLVSVSVLGHQGLGDALTEQVLSQAREWYGKSVDTWQHLKTYDIQYALPQQTPPALDPVEKPSAHRDGVFVCGDHLDTASINGAMASGRRAASLALQFLQRP